MAKVGAILGIIGSTIFMVAGLYTVSMSRIFYTPPGFNMFIYTITGIANISIGAVGITGVVLAFRDINIAGYILLLCAGAVGIIGTFIPIYAYDQGGGYYTYYYLCVTLLYGDLVLMLLGGILGFALGPKKERKDF